LLGPGEILKQVSLFVEGTDAPVAILDIRGVVLPGVTFSPAYVDFGSLKPNEVRTRTVTVVVDRKLLPKAIMPRLISDAPGITTVRDESGGTSGYSIDRDGRHTATLKYHITIGNGAATGTVAAHLRLQLDAKGTDDSQNEIGAARLLVTAKILGDVSVQPAAVVFGHVVPGTMPTQSVTLFGIRRAALESLTVRSCCMWMTAKLDEVGIQRADPTEAEGRTVCRDLTITVSSTAPAGQLNGNVTITLANGEVVFVSVSAFVEGK
jgi:hypothetical protein